MLADDKERVVAALPLFDVDQRVLKVFRTRVLSSGFEFPAQPLIAEDLSARQEQDVLEAVVNAVESTAALAGADDVRITYPIIVGGVPAIVRYGYCPLRHFGYSAESPVVTVLDLRTDKDELSRGLEKACRGAIRRAQKEGCTVRPVRDGEEWMGCLGLARETMGPLAPSEAVHRSCWECFVEPGYATATAVVPPGSDTPSNVVVALGWNRHWYYWKGYNSRERRVPGMNNLALWETIIAAKDRGGVFFEMGSVFFNDPKQVAIAEFKRSFGGTATTVLRGVRHRRPVRRAALGLLSAAYDSWFKS